MSRIIKNNTLIANKIATGDGTIVCDILCDTPVSRLTGPYKYIDRVGHQKFIPGDGETSLWDLCQSQIMDPTNISLSCMVFTGMYGESGGFMFLMDLYTVEEMKTILSSKDQYYLVFLRKDPNDHTQSGIAIRIQYIGGDEMNINYVDLRNHEGQTKLGSVYFDKVTRLEV